MILINALINILLQLKLLENFEGIGNEYKQDIYQHNITINQNIAVQIANHYNK